MPTREPPRPALKGWMSGLKVARRLVGTRERTGSLLVVPATRSTIESARLDEQWVHHAKRWIARPMAMPSDVLEYHAVWTNGTQQEGGRQLVSEALQELPGHIRGQAAVTFHPR